MITRRILFIIINLLILTSIKGQQTATVLYNWQDSSLVGSWAYNNTYNECWGLSINESEIAIIGSTAGTHFFDVTEAANSAEIAFVEGAYTGGGVIHRDYHDFEGYLYIVCDEGNSSTLQIVDISNLPNSVDVVYDSNALFTKSHNIFIDTAAAKLYACASNSAMDVYSLNIPTNPTLIYSYNDVGHVHDAFVRNDSAYLNCGNDGFRVLDFSMVNQMGDQPTLLGSLTSYPDAGYNHSGWLNDDGTLYIMQDENHGYDVKILDVSDLSNISVLSVFNSGVDPNSMAHNGIIKGNMAYIPYYHDGLRVFDISDPNNPIQVWEYDTYTPNDHDSYRGAWGVYPYLPSGNIIVSDMQTGLYIIELSATTNIIDNNSENYIYPNPTTDNFTIISEADNIDIYNSLGIKILNQKLDKNNKTIERKGVTNGLYLYTLTKERRHLKSGSVIFK